MHRLIFLSFSALFLAPNAHAVIRAHHHHVFVQRHLVGSARQAMKPFSGDQGVGVAARIAHFEERQRIEEHNRQIQERRKDFETVNVVHTRKIALDQYIADAFCASSAAYNNRQDVAPLSWAIRKQTENTERLALESKHKVLDFHAAVPGYGDMPAGIAFYARDVYGRGRITIAYHGTECVADGQTDLWSWKKSAAAIGVDGLAHGGFYNRYMQGRVQMQEAVQRLLAAHGETPQSVEFLVSGHSLGGALATLAAVDLKNGIAGKSTVTLVTDGSPRVFDQKGAAIAEALLEGRAMRVWRDSDPVAAVSIGTSLGLGWFTGFKHVGQPIKLAAEKGKGRMGQHSHDAYKRDALSDQVIESLPHQGFWDRWDFKKHTVAQPLKSAPLQETAELAFSKADFEVLADQAIQAPMVVEPAVAPAKSLLSGLSSWWYGVAPAV